MSLVDYASSDEDIEREEEEEEEENKEVEERREKVEAPKPEPSPPLLPQKRRVPYASDHQLETTANLPAHHVEKLPDASLLLNSPAGSASLLSGSDHALRVAAAMAESSLWKRDSHLPSSSAPRGKVPRGTLPHLKSVPDTVGGVLVPPQLSGRSNVVTEDIGKLFVKRQAEPSSN